MVSFPTPWEEASPTNGKVDGWFLAELGSELPGAGWFDAPGAKGHDAVYASVQQVDGAAWPVVHVRLVGHVRAGWHVLELDVALNRWVAGEVAVDGESAVGVLRDADGSVRYVVGGTLNVLAAGIEPGDVVEASFDDLELAEEAR